MILLRRPLVALVALGAALLVAPAGAVDLPVISGELAGKFSTPLLAGFPEIQWHMSVRMIDGPRAHADIAADATGGRLRAEADFDVVTGDGSWKITAGELDAATWFAVIAPKLGTTASGIHAVGTLRLTGGGTLKQRRPIGRVELTWQGGALRHAGQGWSLDDIELRGAYDVDAQAYAVTSAGPLELTVRTITTTRFGARNVLVRGLLNGDGTLALSEARVEIAGGEIRVDPCTVQLTPLKLDLNLHIDRVGLQDVVALVPAALSDARGRVDGEVGVSWSEAAGFQIGAGSLTLRNDEPAIVRLTATPGFLTQRLPARISLLPSWTGALGRWLAPVNPAYHDMQEIEMGRANLRVETLRIDLTPEGDEQGRTAQVYVSARPEQAGGTVKEVTFQVNVSGPLAAVLRLGMNQNMSLNLH